MRKKALIVLVIIFSIITGFYCSSTKETNEAKTIVKGKPKIKVKQEKFDFGEVPDGAEVTHVYEIINVGSDTLFIDNVETSCGCAIPKLEPKDKIIPPDSNKISKIRVTFNSRGRIGPNEKLITVFSNDPVEPAKSLFLVGRVVPKTTSMDNK